MDDHAEWATAPIAIAVSDFSASDHLGHVYPLALVTGQPVPPDRLSPGQTVSFEVRAVMDTGEGLMRWARLKVRVRGRQQAEAGGVDLLALAQQATEMVAWL